MSYRFKKDDWVINKTVSKPEPIVINEVDTSGSARCYRSGNQWYLESELEEAEEKHFPPINFNSPIKIKLCSAEFYFQWGQPTVGFGNFSISMKRGHICADTEGMGPEWCRRAMYAAVDALIEKAKDNNVWPEQKR